MLLLKKQMKWFMKTLLLPLLDFSASASVKSSLVYWRVFQSQYSMQKVHLVHLRNFYQLFLALALPLLMHWDITTVLWVKERWLRLLAEWWSFLILVVLVCIDKRSCLLTGFVFCVVGFFCVCFVLIVCFSGMAEAARLPLKNCLDKEAR